MKLTGYGSDHVDELVAQFSVLMLEQMRKSCDAAAQDVAAQDVLLSDNTLTADGALTTAIDSLAIIYTQWKKSVTATLLPFLEHVFGGAGQYLTTSLGDVSPVKTTTVLADLGNMVSSFSDDMWDAAKTALIEGAQDGESIAQLAVRVENVTQVKAKKAHVIAQTAVIAAVNGGEWQQMMEMSSALDAVTYKEWVSTHDSHTRPTHHAADGQRVALNEPFTVGGGFLQYPGDPQGPPEEIISCRCTTVFDVDTDEPITASQTSLKTLYGSPAATINGVYWPLEEVAATEYALVPIDENAVTAAVNAAFNAAHPRGKDGKFIKKGEGLPEHVLQGLIFSKKSIDWSLFTPQEKDNFITEISDISTSQWNNLKSGDQEHIKQVVSDALDEGWGSSAKASIHLEDLALVETGNDVPDIFNPSTALPTHTPSMTPSAAAAKGVEQDIYNAYDAGVINDNLQQTALDILDKQGPDAAAVFLEKYTGVPATPTTPSAPTLTTGSSTPIKITHGLIHAKYTPGTVIAQSTTGTKITWNGSSYDITYASGNGGEKGVKKSKLYALLNSKYKLAKWKSPGKQETEVTHATHLDAAPPANPIPHPITPTPTLIPWAPIPGLSTSTSGDTFGDSGDVKTEITAKYFADEITQDQFNELVNGINAGTLSPSDAKTKLDSYVSLATPHLSKEEIDKQLAKGLITYDEHAQLLSENGHAPSTPQSSSIESLTQSSVNHMLSGDWSAAQADIDAIALAQAPQSPSTPNVAKTVDLTGWKKVGGQGGSNLGGLYESPSGEKFYVKSLKSKAHAENEVLAAALYNAVGIHVPEVRHGGNHPDGWKNVIISPIVPDAKTAKSKLVSSGSFAQEVHSGYAVDAWLANYDVVGLTHDNIVESNGKPWRIDVGGSLLYRAQGSKKTDWSDDPTAALNGLKDTSKNSQAASVFGGMTDAEEKESAKKLLGITDAQIYQLVHDSGQPASLAATLTARRNFILKKYDLDGQNVSTPPSVATPTPTNTPAVSTPTPVTVADIPNYQKNTFYQFFKNEKVSPAWSGAKIYASMHVAKQKMAGNPQFAGLSDAELLEVLDQQHHSIKGSGIGTPAPVYSDKVLEWLKTPNGQKAFAQLNPNIATITPSLAKKTAKKLVSAPHNVTQTPSDVLGEHDVSALSAIQKTHLYSAFKAAGVGAYLKSSPHDIFYTATQTAKANPGISPLQVLKIADEEGAKKFGVTNTNLFEKKITDWAATPVGKTKIVETYNDALLSGVGVAAKKVAKKASPSYGGSSHAHPANTPLGDKIPAKSQVVEAFDPAKKYNWTNKTAGPPVNDFPVLSTGQAKTAWDSSQAVHGDMKPAQRAALRKYTGSSYTAMNNYLRGYSGADETTHKNVQSAQAGMRPSTQPMVLHRGNGWFKGWQNVAEIKAKKGTQFKQEAFFSASVGGKSGFSGDINFVIECPPGTPMAYVKYFSQHGGENEMLLAGNLDYEVVDVLPGNVAPDGSQHSNTKVTVVLRVIPPSTTAIAYGSAVI